MQVPNVLLIQELIEVAANYWYYSPDYTNLGHYKELLPRNEKYPWALNTSLELVLMLLVSIFSKNMCPCHIVVVNISSMTHHWLSTTITTTRTRSHHCLVVMEAHTRGQPDTPHNTQRHLLKTRTYHQDTCESTVYVNIIQSTLCVNIICV